MPLHVAVKLPGGPGLDLQKMATQLRQKALPVSYQDRVVGRIQQAHVTGNEITVILELNEELPKDLKLKVKARGSVEAPAAFAVYIDTEG